MAKVRGPLMSLDARGNYAAKVQFRGGLCGTHAYRPAPPTTVNQAAASGRQAAIRAAYRRTAHTWRALSPTDRQAWNASAAASPQPISGWNLFLQTHIGPVTYPIDALLTISDEPILTKDGELLLIDRP